MLNYRFISNTISGDDEEFDTYLVGQFEAVEKSRLLSTFFYLKNAIIFLDK